jgi:predicted ATPase
MSIERIEIKNFRGIRDGLVSGLSPMSILLGPNNSGKSTVLEALWCVGNGTNAADFYRLLLRRGGPPLHALNKVFNTEGNVVISAKVAEKTYELSLAIARTRGTERFREAIDRGMKEPLVQMICATKIFSVPGKMELSEVTTYVDAQGSMSSPLTEPGEIDQIIHAMFVDIEAVRAPGELEDAYSRLEQNRKVGLVVKALQRSMPTLTDLRILKNGDQFIVHSICGEEPPVPVYLAGDGFKRFLEIASHVYATGKGGVVLLEEPESFQHPRYLQELVAVLRDAVSQGIQVILSTHSLELIDLLLAGSGEETTVHRFRLQESVLRTTAVSGEKARTTRKELTQDLRA